MDPMRRDDMLGPYLKFDIETYVKLIKSYQDQLLMGGLVPAHWSSVQQLEEISEWPIMKDHRKLERLLLLNMEWDKPYLLSLADFLPSSSRFDYSNKKASVSGRSYLREALRNLPMAMDVLLGVQCYDFAEEYEKVLKDNSRTATTPDAYLFYLANEAIARVMLEFRTHRDTGVGMPYDAPMFFRLHLVKAIRDLLRRIPTSLEQVAIIDVFMERRYDEVQWSAPKLTQPSTQAIEEGDISSNKKRKSRSQRQRDAIKKVKLGMGNLESPKVASENVRTSSPIERRPPVSNETKIKSEKTSFTVHSICPYHLASLLGVANATTGKPMICTFKDKCKAGAHPDTLANVIEAQARAAIPKARGMSEALKNNIKSALDALPAGSLKAN